MPAPKDPIKYAEFIEKLRQNAIKQFANPEARKKASEIAKKRLSGHPEKHPFYGHHHTEESNQKNREAHLGEKSYFFGLKGEKNPNYGKRGNKSSSWRGGRQITEDGYVRIYFPSSHLSNNKGYVLEHRLVAEQYLERILSKIEIIHHINGVRDDNRPENLYLFVNRSEHIKFHHNPYFITSNII